MSVEYSDRIDAQIAELLSSRNRVTPAHLPGIPDEEGAALLQHYAELHGAEEHIAWDGARLVRERPATATSAMPTESPQAQRPSAVEPMAAGPVPDEPRSKPSPVDEILAAPVDRSLLDSASSGAVPRWMWLLPLMLALPGGLIAWLLVRDTNRTIARALLITGVIVTVLSILAGTAFQGIGARLSSIIQQSQ